MVHFVVSRVHLGFFISKSWSTRWCPLCSGSCVLPQLACFMEFLGILLPSLLSLALVPVLAASSSSSEVTSSRLPVLFDWRFRCHLLLISLPFRLHCSNWSSCVRNPCFWYLQERSLLYQLEGPHNLSPPAQLNLGKHLHVHLVFIQNLTFA